MFVTLCTWVITIIINTVSVDGLPANLVFFTRLLSIGAGLAEQFIENL